MRRFVVIGQRAKATPDFLLVDLPSTSGRLDVLLRCLRAALLVSHAVRHDCVMYLVLLGSEQPKTVRIDGAAARYLRPDERSLATLLKKALATTCADAGFCEVRPGISIANGGLSALGTELRGVTAYILEEGGAELRDFPHDSEDVVFFLGDHLGFDAATRAALAELNAVSISVGPTSLHSEDVIAVVNNELDRRAASRA